MTQPDFGQMREISRAEYQATLNKISPDGLRKLLWEQYRVRIGTDVPKSEMIQRILDVHFEGTIGAM